MRKKKIHPATKWLLIIGSGVVALYIFIFYLFGFLVNLAFTVRDRVTPQKAVTTNEEPLVRIDPLLEDVPYATNTARIQVHGTAMVENAVDLYVNNEKVDSQRSDFDGAVAFDVLLQQGDNELYITSLDADSKKKLTSQVYAVWYSDIPPTLTLEGIEDGKMVDTPEITVQGTTDKEVFVQVNGAPVVVRADGSFSTTVRLKEGTNVIVVTASDVAGNEAKEERTVEYKK